MSGGHGPEEHGGHGGGGGGSDAMGAYMFGHKEVGAAAGIMTGICSTIFMGLFDSGGGGGHDSGHH